jgi:addiction module HigA family antidote
MRTRTRAPGHPGGILKRLYLDSPGISNAQLAACIGVARKTVSKIVNGRGAVTPDMALRLSRAFNTSPELWLNLQVSYELWQASHRSIEWQNVKAITSRATHRETAV